jgi:hypothetical protein
LVLQYKGSSGGGGFGGQEAVVKSGVIMMEDGQVVEKMNTMEVKAAMKNMHIRMRYEQNQEVKD